MWLWSMVFVGILTFVSGLHFLLKNYRNGKYAKEYGYLSYIGLSLTVLGIILLMEPVFINLPGNLPGMLPSFISLSIFLIAGRLLLKPTFFRK